MVEDPQELKWNIEATRRDVGRDVDALAEKMSPGRAVGRRAARARGGLHRLKEQVMGSVGDTAGSAVSTMQDAGSKVSDAVGSAPEVARSRTRGTPLAAGVIAFAAGWVAAAALPVSTRERELAQETKDTAMEASGPVKQQAADAAHELKENLKDPAQEAVEQVKQSASQAATEAADEARSATQHVTEEAKDSATTIRQTGSSS
jgi:gas vesicle protein